VFATRNPENERDVRISVVGTGHVGLVTAACLAHLGHDVLGIDQDVEKARLIGQGEIPFHEPGLLELVRQGLDAGRFRMASAPEVAPRHGEIVFICVGTPSHPSGEANLVFVEQVSRTVAQNLHAYTVVTEKSTVPVQTGRWVERTIRLTAAPGTDFDVASNPEFLREGRAVRDTLEPDRIVVGATSPRALELLRDAYQPILDRARCPFIGTDLATAELIKHASNAFLATKISFANVLADVCEEAGADVQMVVTAMGLDGRIGPEFLRPGIGYGGACLPKDVRAFTHKMRELGLDAGLLDEVDAVNHTRIDRFIDRIGSLVRDLEGKRIVIWGLAFKPDTDDLRNAPALGVATRLAEAGASVVAHDPVAIPAAKELLPGIAFNTDPYEAARGANCLVICTEWQEYAGLDLDRLRGLMADALVIDGRNLFDPEQMQRSGFTYASVGRRTVSGQP
jgi:UDPglucose 6-dehydrogenase